jgi:hypothetical protein
MKTLTQTLVVLVAVVFSISTTNAQSARKERQAAKVAEVKKMMESGKFSFEANTAMPMRGGTRQLTSTYDLQITKDTIKSFLPYFGVAYVAPTDPTEGGIKFTSTSFDYSIAQNKKGSWDILIKPKDKTFNDMRSVEQLRLSVSQSGYASLQVTSTNRDPITFDGEVVKGD